MKATGIVRRIDDLGRVVIPKEIRRTLRIREGDPLEIFTDREGEVILKKYSPIGELSLFAKQYAEALAQTSGCVVCVTDTDQVIASAGIGKKEFQEKFLNKQMEKLMSDREALVAKNGERRFVKIIREQPDEYETEVIAPILCEGDVIGTVVMLGKEKGKEFGETEQKLAVTAAGFLGRQMEQ